MWQGGAELCVSRLTSSANDQVHEGGNVRHQEDKRADQGGQGQAVQKDVAKNVSLVAVPLGGRGSTTMLWASIILPITPPVLFAAAISTGGTFTCCAVIF